MSVTKNKRDYSSLNSEELRAFQLKKLNNLITYLNDNSIYYQNLFKENDIDPSSINSFEDFEKIPFTSKPDLTKHEEDLLCVTKDKIKEYSTTSGTIGTPLSVCLTEKDLERLAYNEYTSLKKAGISSKDIVQLSTTMDKRFMAGLAYYEGIRKIGAGLIRVGASSPSLQWDSILRFKPTAIIAIPAFILKLIEYGEKEGIDYKKSSIKKLVAIGQPVRNDDFSLNAISKGIREKWDIEIYSTYASTEMATAFTECEHGVGGHLQEDLAYVEVVNEQGEVVEDGEKGEVVISTFGIEAMPLLRYKTGDIARIHKSRCECGRTTPRIGPILGRRNHIIKYKGTTIHPSSILPLLDSHSDIKSYVLRITTDELGLDVLSIVLPKETTSSTVTEELKQLVGDKINVKPKIELISQQELSKITFDPANRKPVKIVDLRS